MIRRQFIIHTKSSSLRAPRVGLIHFVPAPLGFGSWSCWISPGECGIGAAHRALLQAALFPIISLGRVQ